MTQRVQVFKRIKRNILEKRNIKMEKNNLYITDLCVGHRSIYYQTPEVPDRDIGDDIKELLEDKYTHNVSMRFIYVDCDGIEYRGEITVNGIGDYEDFEMYDEDFHENTQLTDENLIDLFEFD